MEPISFLSQLIRIVGMIFPSLQKYYNQPKLYLVVTWNSTFKGAGLASRKNQGPESRAKDQVIWVSPMAWDYTITIRNNTEFPAYNLKLLKPDVSSTVIINPPLDDLKPLVANSEVSYNITIRVKAEGKSHELENQMANRPEQLTRKKLVLEYTNAKQAKFYTVFDYNSKGRGQNVFFTAYNYELIKPYL